MRQAKATARTMSEAVHSESRPRPAEQSVSSWPNTQLGKNLGTLSPFWEISFVFNYVWKKLAHPERVGWRMLCTVIGGSKARTIVDHLRKHVGIAKRAKVEA